MENEFGTGLRAHLGRRVAPAEDAADAAALSAPSLAAVELAPSEPIPAAPMPPARPNGPTLDERIHALSAAEAELSFRERRVGEREMSFNVSVQRVVYRLAQEMLDGDIPALPQDELAVARARRGGRAA